MESYKKDRRLFILLLVFFCLEIVRPQDSFLPFLEPLRLPGISNLLLLLFSLFLFLPKVYMDRQLYPLYKFLFVVFLSALFAEDIVPSLYLFKELIIYFLVFIIPVWSLVRSERDISVFFFWLVVFSMLVGLWAIMHGGRGTGRYTADENDLALFMCMFIPIAIYYANYSKISRNKRIFLRIAAIVMVVSVIASFSRGGFLGLVSVFGVMFLFSRKKLKLTMVSLLVLLTLSLGALKFLPKGYIEDMGTITDDKNSTRVERFRSWELGWVMFKDNPIIGVGPGNYIRVVGEYDEGVEGKRIAWRQAHSLYFTLLPELGLTGVLFYGMLVGGIFGKMRKLIALEKNGIAKDIELYVLFSKAIVVSLTAFFVSGAFLSVLYYSHLYMFFAFSAVIYRNASVALENRR